MQNSVICPPIATAMLNALFPQLAGGELVIFNGARPISGGDETTRLLVYPLGNPAGAIVGTTIEIIPPVFKQALSSGTADWCRIYDDAGAWLIDGDCGVTGSGTFCEFPLLDITKGALYFVDAFILRF
jgi:hypothetical protein